MAIEWYPGHMTKARREIAQALSGIDVVIEVVDARLPASSSNPILEKLRGAKPCVKVLNKKDLADPGVTRAWVRHLSAQKGVAAVPVEAKNRKEAGAILRRCRSLVPHKGRAGRSLRVMVVGIPNVGKSTLINTLAGKGITRVGDRPALTTCRQQVKLPNHIILDDTPGLLWPNLGSRDAGLRLAASGAIGASAFDTVEVACFAIAFLLQRYPGPLIQRYPFAEGETEPSLILEAIGRRHGCLIGGGVDLTRAGEFFLRALRAGKLGRISFETPGDESSEAPGGEGQPEKQDEKQPEN